MFLFFRRRGSDLPSRLDPDADANIRQYDLRHRHGVVRVHGRIGDRQLLFGKIADRGKNDFLLYGILEAGVGVYGFPVPWLFAVAQKVYGPIFWPQ